MPITICTLPAGWVISGWSVRVRRWQEEVARMHDANKAAELEQQRLMEQMHMEMQRQQAAAQQQQQK